MTRMSSDDSKSAHGVPVPSTAEPAAETIALVSCVKQKQSVPAPARDLYTSALFSKARRYAESHAGRWFILSAKYGLVAPDQVIDPYEQTLNTMAARERREWARRVHGQMWGARMLRPGVRFVWLAGAAYQNELSKLIELLPG